MKRINHHLISVEPNEVLDFEEVFSAEPGVAIDAWQSFQLAEDNPGICIRYRTPAHTENNLRFFYRGGTSALYVPRRLLCSTEPYPQSGSESVIAEHTYKTLVFFVNDTDTHPQGDQFKMAYVFEDGRRVMKKVKADKGTWMKPDTDYFITMEKRAVTDGTLSLFTTATDGGEVPLDCFTDTAEGERIDLGAYGGKGIFIPDE